MGFRNFLNFVLCLFIVYFFTIFIPFVHKVFVSFSVAIVGIKLAEWLMSSTRKYFLYDRVCPDNKSVLITGCDSGFGNTLARRMDRLGYKVFAACLNPQGEGAMNLENDCSRKLTILALDVTNVLSIKSAKEFVEKNLGQNVLWAVVNNAGIGQLGEMDWTSEEEIQRVHDVNCSGTLRVTKAFLPFIKKSKGRIVNLTSIAGRYHMAGFTGYCMSKSAAVAFTTGLRIELAKWGVKVICIEPFFYSTLLTGIQAASATIENTWKTAPEDVKEDYGESYKDAFKNSTARCLRRYNNPNVHQVIDCLEDAITAKEPLSTYFPCTFIHKVLITLALHLPSVLNEIFQRMQLEMGIKPAALVSNKKI